MADPQMSTYEYMRRQQQDSLQYQLEFGEVLDRIRKYLEGQYWDNSAKVYVPYSKDTAGNAKPIMTQEGVNLVMRTLVITLHKGISLADITEEEAVRYAQEIHRDMAKTLFIHSDVVGMSPADIRQGTKLISITIYAALTRAIKGATAERVNKIVSVSEQKLTGDRKPGVL